MIVIKILFLISAFGLFFVNLYAQESKAQLVVQTGHTAKINSIDISRDGKFVASASADNSIKIWSLQSGLELMTLTGHTSEVHSVSFSPNGEKIVSGGGDGVKIWDVKTGKITETPSGLPTFTVTFSPDGKRIAAGDDETAKVWNLSDLKKPIILNHCIDQGRLIESQTNAILTVIFDADSSGLYTQGICIGSDTYPVYWNLSSYSPDKTVPCRLSGVRPFENGYFAQIRQTCLSEKLKILFKGRTWAEVSEKISGNYPNYQPEFAIAPDGKIVVTATDANLRFWDAKTGATLHDKNQFANSVTAITLSPDSRFLAAKGNGNLIKLYDLSKGGEPKNLNGHREAVKSIAFDYESKILVSRGENEYKMWDVFTGKSIAPPADKKMLPFAITPTTAISPDGKIFASADAGINVFDVMTRNSEEASGGYPGEVYAVALSKPEGNNYYLAVISYIGYKGTTLDEYLVINSDGNIAAISSGQGEPVGDFRQRVRPGWLKEYLVKYPELEKKWEQFINEPKTGDGKFKFKIKGSGALTIFDAKTDAELCSLMTFGANDWAVVTPDGLFDGTAQAWKQMRWRLDADISSLVPVEAFFNEFYYPGLLQEILSGKKPKLPAKNLASIDIRQPTVSITEIGGQVVDPAKELSVNKRRVTLQVEVTDNNNQGGRAGLAPSSGAYDLRLFRNGSLIKHLKKDVFALSEDDGCLQTPANAKSPRKATCHIDIPVVAGDNTYSAYAFNQENVKSADAAATVKGETSLERSGTLYVLAVGVNKYANPSFNLRYAVADVEAIGKQIRLEQLKLPGKPYAETKVVSLTDEKASKENIVAALKMFSGTNAPTPNLPSEMQQIKRIEPEDALIIYFAGHGLADKDRFYLIPHDGIPTTFTGSANLNTIEQQRLLTQGKGVLDKPALEQLFSQSISDIELEDLLETVNAGKLMMVIDACNSGQALEAEEKRRGPMNSRGLAQLAYEKGMNILTASQGFQAALEATALNHGLLTYALLEGLQKGDANGDKSIIDREWLDYGVITVPRLQIEAMNKRLLTQNKENSISGKEDKSELQTPRVFYRRESDSRPFTIALPD